jgi:hypothetical protein
MDVDYMLSKAEAETQAKLSSSTKKVIQSGISTEEGLYGALQGGLFLNNHFSYTERSQDEIKTAIATVARGRLIAAIWKATVSRYFFFFFYMKTLVRYCSIFHLNFSKKKKKKNRSF